MINFIGGEAGEDVSLSVNQNRNVLFKQLT